MRGSAFSSGYMNLTSATPGSKLSSGSGIAKVEIDFKPPKHPESSFLAELTKHQDAKSLSKQKKTDEIVYRFMKEDEPDHLTSELDKCTTAKEVLDYFKRTHKPLTLKKIYNSRHAFLSQNTSFDKEHSRSSQENLELIRLNEGNFTLGVKGQSYQNIVSNPTNDPDEIYVKSLMKKSPWVQTRHNLKLSESTELLYKLPRGKIQESKKTNKPIVYRSFLINDGFYSKNKDKINLIDSKNVSRASSIDQTGNSGHHRSNSTAFLSSTRLLPEIAKKKKPNASMQSADFDGQLSAELLPVQPTIDEVSKRYETADMVLRVDKIESTNESVALPSTAKRAQPSMRHTEVLNGSRGQAEIGFTYPQLLADNLRLQRHLLTTGEKKTWEQFKGQNKSLVKGILQGESNYHLIEAQFQHLSEIHKNSQMSDAASSSFSAAILRSSLERKVGKKSKETGLSTKEYNELRKKSDMRLAFMFAEQIDSVKTWLKYDQKVLQLKRQKEQTSVLEQSQSQPSSMEKAQEYERIVAKRRWKLLTSFLLYLVRQKLNRLVDYLKDCNFYTTPNGVPGCEDFFVAIKTKNIEMVKKLAKKEPLFLYCFDAVGWSNAERQDSPALDRYSRRLRYGQHLAVQRYRPRADRRIQDVCAELRHPGRTLPHRQSKCLSPGVAELRRQPLQRWSQAPQGVHH